jgi:hypothetical protein
MMDWGVPPDSIETTKANLIQLVKQRKETLGKSGWCLVSASLLYEECGRHVTLQMFGRHMKRLGVTKEHTRTGTMYALFIQ